MMKRKMKTLVLALAAMAAFGAVGAPVVAADEITAEAYPTTLTGSVDPGFTDEVLTTVGAVRCTTPKYTGTIAGATTSITMTATYAGCTTAGIPSTILTNGCSVKINILGGASTTGDGDLVCPAGSEVTVTVTPASGTHPCTAHIKAQSDIAGGVSVTNIGVGATRELTVNAELSGLDYTHTKGTGLAACPAGSATNGTLKAKVIVTGEVDPSGVHRGLFLSSI